MRCSICGIGSLQPGFRPKVVERDGKVAVVRGVPVLECDNCGDVYLDAAVARQLDVLFRRLLEGPVDQVVAHFDPATAA